MAKKFKLKKGDEVIVLTGKDKGKTGKIIKDSISDETEQVMKNLSSILNEASISFENVVKTTIFLSDMNDFSLVNEVYGKYFDEDTAKGVDNL